MERIYKQYSIFYKPKIENLDDNFDVIEPEFDYIENKSDYLNSINENEQIINFTQRTLYKFIFKKHNLSVI